MTTKVTSTSRTTTEVREVQGYYWERCKRSAAPLVVGALGLAALGIGQLLPLRHSAETDLRSRSQAALSAAGLAGITVDFTGQDGVLTGNVASKDDETRALAIVRGLEGVRVATSRLTLPGSGSATPGTDGTTDGTTTSSPSASDSPATSPAVSESPAATSVPSPAATSVPSPAQTGTVVPTPPAASPSPSLPAPGPSEPVALQNQLRALPQITFAHASAELTPAGRASVLRAAAILKSASASRTFRIDGYTDDLGDWDVNLVLSKARGEAVKQVLVANGVPAARLAVVGWSEERPKAPNTSEANRALNRRVEIVVR